MPIGACSNGTSFSSRACGAWSVAMQSIVPVRRPSISAWRSSSERSGGFIFSRVSSFSSSASSVSVRWCGLASQRDLHAARLGLGDGLDRLARAQVLDVDAAVLVAGDRGVAGDQRRLADAGDARQPEPRGDLALVHDAVARERRVLLVQGDDPADELLVLERLAQQPRAVDGLAVVGEAERAGLLELGHLGQRVAVQAGGDARRGSRRGCAPRGGPVAQAAQDRRGVDRRARVRHRHDGDEAAGGRGARAGLEVLLVLLARARAGARAGRRSPGRRACPRRR